MSACVEVFEREGVRIAASVAKIGGALDLVAACRERDATRLLLESRHLPSAFFELRSGCAGELLQKLANYGLRVAGVFPEEPPRSEAFAAFLAEARRGRSFRVFSDRVAAEEWLATG
jgi:hypothetical protein